MSKIIIMKLPSNSGVFIVTMILCKYSSQLVYKYYLMNEKILRPKIIK